MPQSSEAEGVSTREALSPARQTCAYLISKVPSGNASRCAAWQAAQLP
jgi:hypothetical protein